MAENIVEEWLRSLDLVQYTQSFLDNGYDELDICKEIGHADLDAIGVEDPLHREGILCSVHIMREQGTSVVYFTLDPDYVVSDYDAVYNEADLSPCSGDVLLNDSPDTPPPPIPRWSCHPLRGNRVTFPHLQLFSILKDKLAVDDIFLGRPENKVQQRDQQTSNSNVCDDSMLHALSIRYADELNTHADHVLDVLHHIRRMNDPALSSREWSAEPEVGSADSRVNSGASTSSDSGNTTPALRDHDQPLLDPLSTSNNNIGTISCATLRGLPPKLPTCPPPSSTTIEQLGLDLEYRSQRSSSLPQTVLHDGGEELASSTDIKDLEPGGKKKSSTIGRFFKNVTLRRSGRRYIYKQHKGDPHASEITMPDEDRINLMILVKEGKITMNEALEIVKNYEHAQRDNGSDGSRSEIDISHEFSSGSSSSPDARSLNNLTSSPATNRPIPVSQSVDPSYLPPRRSHSSTDDYFDPPSHLSPDDEIPAGFSPIHCRSRTRSTSEHNVINSRTLQTHTVRQIAESTPGMAVNTSQVATHWLSPMLLRRQGSTPVTPPSVASTERRGMYSSPFIKRKSGVPLKPGAVPRVPPHELSKYSHTLDRFGVARPVYATEFVNSYTSRGPECISRRCPPQSSVAAIARQYTPKTSPHRTLPAPPSPLPCQPQTVSIDVHRPCDSVKFESRIDVELTSPHLSISTGPDDPASDYTPLLAHTLKNCNTPTVIHTSLPETPLTSERTKGGSCESPDLGVGEESSPTGTLDSATSDDFKDSKYGSASTMSVGSDGSPILENKRAHKNNKISTSTLRTKPFEVIHPCHHGNSAGEECMSSDYDDQEESQRNSVIDVQTMNASNRLLAHSVGFPSPTKTILSATSSDMSAGSGEDSPRRKRTTKLSRRPRTVSELLSRLSLQHLHSVFESNGFDSLSQFSELDEQDLNELSISSSQDRAKLLTAAQLVLDYHGDVIDEGCVDASQSPSTTASSRDSSHDSLPHISASLSTDGRVLKLIHTQSDPTPQINPNQDTDDPNDHEVISINNQTNSYCVQTANRKPLVTFGSTATRTDQSLTNIQLSPQKSNESQPSYVSVSQNDVSCRTGTSSTLSQTSDTTSTTAATSPHRVGSVRSQIPVRAAIPVTVKSPPPLTVKSPPPLTHNRQVSKVRDKV